MSAAGKGVWVFLGVVLYALLKLIFDNILYAGLMARLKEYGVEERDLTAMVTANLLPILATVAVSWLIYWLASQHHADPLRGQKKSLVDDAFGGFDTTTLNWIRKSYIGGRPSSEEVAKALFAANLIDRDHTGWTEVKPELKPIIARKIRSLDARWKIVLRRAAKLEPTRLIVLGLVGVIIFGGVALGGVIWQWRRAPIPDPKIAALEAQITTLQKDAAAARASAPILNPVEATIDPIKALKSDPAPKPRYNDGEIRKLIDVMAILREIADAKVAPKTWEMSEFRNVWVRRLKAEGAATIAAYIKDYADPMQTASNEINKILYDYQHYDDQVRPTIEGFDAVNAFQNTTLDLAREVGEYSNAQNVDVAKILDARFQQWFKSGDDVSRWVSLVDVRITTKTKQLREWDSIPPAQPQPLNVEEARPASKQFEIPQNERLLRDPRVNYDQYRLSLQGRFARPDGPVSIYVTYGQTSGLDDRQVMAGALLVGSRIKIGSLDHFDRDEMADVTLGTVMDVEGGQQVLQWGEPRQNNIKVGISWGSYFGSVIFVWRDGREDRYPFAVIAKSQQGRPVPPVFIGPDILMSMATLK